MSLHCAISGEVPQDPVVSPVSGAVFERRLIEKHLGSSQTDPINGEPLAVEQLVALKVPKALRPRPPNATSIPSLLKLFQDEWDAVMLESFKLRQHVETVRQELSHALYQHDAACRVIARLTKERDQARQALAVLQAVPAPAPAPAHAAAASSANGAAAMDADGSNDAVIAKLQAKCDELSAHRKERKKSPNLATTDDIKALAQASSNTSLHSASAPGITALDVHANDNNIIATGGADKKALVYNLGSDTIVATYAGHSKKVTGVVLHPTSDTVISSSLDSTVAVWGAKDGQGITTITPHTKGVAGISLHPTGDFVLSASADKSWAFSDLHAAKKVSGAAGGAGLSCIQWHPDGIIFGAGTADSVVRIWDIKQPSNIHTFEGHTGAITAVAFSENGYYLASAAEDATVKLWDLRKLANIKTIDLRGGAASSLAFDYSGVYLGVGAAAVSIYVAKSCEHVKTVGDFGGAVTGLVFGKHARSLVAASMDRSLRTFS